MNNVILDICMLKILTERICEEEEMDDKDSLVFS